MKLVNKYAEVQLFAKADALSQQFHETWRCVYIKLSGRANRANGPASKNFIANSLSDLLSSKEGSIYVCDGGDVFILFQGNLLSVMNKLTAHFGDFEANSYPKSAKSPFIIFDLSRQFAEFFSLCETKHLQAIVESEVARAEILFQKPVETPAAARQN